MEDINIKEVLATPNEAVQFFKSRHSGVDFKKLKNEYDPEGHLIHDEAVRPDKVITTSAGVTKRSVARLSLPFQRIIVDRAAAFLIGEGVDMKASPDSDQQKRMIEALNDVWHDNKLDYRTRQMARIWMSETEVAEYWYFNGDPTRMRQQIWATSMGDDLYPYFNEYGDMEAFARGYKVGQLEYLDVWTDDEHISYVKYVNWEEEKREKNKLGKIPVVFYQRERPEWADVQSLIERYETMVSNFADQNDYFAAPIVKVKGKVHGFADKGEQGKMITLEENADASYLTWDQAPAAIELEKNTLQELIYSMTQTPDISFTQMKGLGNITGIALRMMFMDAKLKTLKHQEEFGEGLQRRMNLLKRGLMMLNPDVGDLRVEPEFTFYMPQNDQELIGMLVTAVGGKSIMSTETAVANNPFVTDVEKELGDIEADNAGDFGDIIP